MNIKWFRVRDDIFNIGFEPSRIAIYAYLSKLSNRDGYCQVRHKVIAENTVTSRRTVMRALKELEDQGFIKIINDGEGSNKYIVPTNMDKLEVIDRRLKRDFIAQKDAAPGNSLTPEGRNHLYYDWINDNQ